MTASTLLTHVCCHWEHIFSKKSQTVFILPLLVSGFKNIFNNKHMWHKGERKLGHKICNIYTKVLEKFQFKWSAKDKSKKKKYLHGTTA